MPAPHGHDDRLSRISTRWSVVMDAHSPEHSISRARCALLHRYRGAVYRYLLGATRDEETAEDLCQEFAVKLLEGRFQRANPDRGRFRDYVKTSLINMVNDYFRRCADAPDLLPSTVRDKIEVSREEDEETFNRQWRDEVMSQTWQKLENERPVYFRLLRLRIDQPDSTSRELAEEYTRRYDGPMTSANVRKTLERAHTRFADLLVAEVADSLDDPTRESLVSELEELDLVRYCRAAVARWAETAE